MAAERHREPHRTVWNCIELYQTVSNRIETAAKSAVLTTRHIRQEARKPSTDSLCVLRRRIHALPLCRRHRGDFYVRVCRREGGTDRSRFLQRYNAGEQRA